MDKALIKLVLSELSTVVDGVVAATPNPWDNFAWKIVKSTLLSDAVIDAILARYLAAKAAGETQPA